MRKQIQLLLLSSVTWLPLIAKADLSEKREVTWGVSVGMNQYKEPNLMQLQGPEIGVHARLTGWSYTPHTQLEADVLFGKQNYTSKSSGDKDGVHNLETRWRAITPLFSDPSIRDSWYTGIALHTLWNDLRGTTTYAGVTYGGYQRSAYQLWWPVRWIPNDQWTLDAGLLIYGRHTSKLSEVSTSYQDITNTQRRGQYAQVTMNISLSQGDTLKPFVRYTHLADSNIVAMGGEYWLEPASHRWQVGAIWEFTAP